MTRDKKTKENLFFFSFLKSSKIIKTKINSDQIIVYPNDSAFFNVLSQESIEKYNHPLFKYRHLMSEINECKLELISELFLKLNLSLPENLLDVNFDEINRKLMLIEPKKIYEDLYLHLIIFAGEYINSTTKNKGKWILKHNHNYPLVYQPTFVDSKNIDYYYSINMNLSRELKARFLGEDYAIDNEIDLKKQFDLKSIIYFSFDYRDIKK